MNKCETIYNFVCRLEDGINQSFASTGLFKYALNVDSNDRYEILRVRNKLAEHIYELEEFIESERESLKIDVGWSKPIIDVLCCPLEYSHEQIKRITGKLFPYGKMTLGLLVQITNSKLINHETLSTENLDNIKNKTNELIEEILATQMDADVKSYLAKQLRKFIFAVDHYQIYGNEGLLEILEEALGHTLTNQHYKTYMKSEESNKWRSFLNDVSTTLATSESLIAIGTTLQKFIP